jgi:hypothetical protein
MADKIQKINYKMITYSKKFDNFLYKLANVVL